MFQFHDTLHMHTNYVCIIMVAGSDSKPLGSKSISYMLSQSCNESSDCGLCTQLFIHYVSRCLQSCTCKHAFAPTKFNQLT